MHTHALPFQRNGRPPLATLPQAFPPIAETLFQPSPPHTPPLLSPPGTSEAHRYSHRIVEKPVCAAWVFILANLVVAAAGAAAVVWLGLKSRSLILRTAASPLLAVAVALVRGVAL
jgi:hypothetical protein